jgi:predicted RNA-binding Zn-ribbon protein involved in translation (DUF1610 family)
MIFPDPSPIAFMAILLGLLAVGLGAAGRDLLRAQRDQPPLACPHCGLAFDPARWPRHNERVHVDGRYTISPTYNCPRCGHSVRMASS